jgi:hypothetical protein
MKSEAKIRLEKKTKEKRYAKERKGGKAKQR